MQRRPRRELQLIVAPYHDGLAGVARSSRLRHPEVVAAAITAYNPDSDTDGRMAANATRILAAVAQSSCNRVRGSRE
jgi:hypothetical protein